MRSITNTRNAQQCNAVSDMDLKQTRETDALLESDSNDNTQIHAFCQVFVCIH
jgi:hypothetical protein